MLVYRPSRGNDSVALTYNGEWAGQSIGREVIIKDKFIKYCLVNRKKSFSNLRLV
jgi:hypothetical protein